jgi:acetyltransferase-like isoleucine patch superfamily enzyme
MTTKEQWTKPEIKDRIPTIYGWVVQHPENLKLGNYVDIGFGTYINASYDITIEDEVMIGSHCSIYSANTIDSTFSEIIIKKNAKIGAGSVILPRKDKLPLIIGENAKIGALTLIKNSIKPNSVVVGSPAHYIIKEGKI